AGGLLPTAQASAPRATVAAPDSTIRPTATTHAARLCLSQTASILAMAIAGATPARREHRLCPYARPAGQSRGSSYQGDARSTGTANRASGQHRATFNLA